MEELELVVLVSKALCEAGPGESECFVISIVKPIRKYFWMPVVLAVC